MTVGHKGSTHCDGFRPLSSRRSAESTVRSSTPRARSASRTRRPRACCRSAAKASSTPTCHPLGQQALRLLDQHPALQRRLELVGPLFVPPSAPLLEYAHGGGVGECLGQLDGGRRHRPGRGTEQAERAYHLLAPPQRHREDRVEAADPGPYGEVGPAACLGGQFGGGHRRPAPVALEPGARAAALLGQCQQPGRFVGGGGHPQLAAPVGEQQPRPRPRLSSGTQREASSSGTGGRPVPPRRRRGCRTALRKSPRAAAPGRCRPLRLPPHLPPCPRPYRRPLPRPLPRSPPPTPLRARTRS